MTSSSSSCANGSLQALLRRQLRTTKPAHATTFTKVVSATGFEQLDGWLPGGGWPVGAVIEMLHDEPGIGELSLLLPALACESRLLVLIAPPHVPCVAMLNTRGISAARILVVDVVDCAQALWACEQALRSGACCAVLMWPEPLLVDQSHSLSRLNFTALRRLQLAAAHGATMGVLFRRLHSIHSASPARLRLALRPHGQSLDIELVKPRTAHVPSMRIPMDQLHSQRN